MQKNAGTPTGLNVYKHNFHLLLPFLKPGNFVRAVQRTDQSFQACNDIVACFAERAKVEKQYAQQLSQWSNKWKSIVDSRKYLKQHVN